MIRYIKKYLLIFAMILSVFCITATVNAAGSTASTQGSASSAGQTAGGRWITSSKGRQYRFSDGTYAKNMWLQIDGGTYRFNKKGFCRTGWFTQSKKRYYASQTGLLYINRFFQDAGGRYWLGSTGACAKKQWIVRKNKRYYATKSGKLAVNRMLKVGGKYYYFNGKGVMAKSKWVTRGVKKYYFDKNGVRLQKKWMKLGGKYYYFSSGGVMQTNRWVGEYYVGADGARMTNCTVDGIMLDGNGRPVKAGESGDYIFVGDSRTVGMKAARPEPNTVYIAEIGMGYYWLSSTACNTLASSLAAKPGATVVLAFGVNDLGNCAKYITYYKQLISAYPDASFYVLSVNPVDEKKEAQHGYKVKNKDIVAFNKQMKAAFGSSYINSYSYLKKRTFNSRDGVHYTADVYSDLYDFVLNKIGSSAS